MATSSRDMGNMMRAKRRALDEYMYEPPDVKKTTVAVIPGDDTSSEETTEPVDNPVEESAETPMIEVLGPDDPSDPDQYTYEKMDTGAWMVYPPGVPCETGKSRIQLDHPATEADFADMDKAIGASDTGEAGASTEGEGY